MKIWLEDSISRVNDFQSHKDAFNMCSRVPVLEEPYDLLLITRTEKDALSSPPASVTRVSVQNVDVGLDAHVVATKCRSIIYVVDIVNPEFVVADGRVRRGSEQHNKEQEND